MPVKLLRPCASRAIASKLKTSASVRRLGSGSVEDHSHTSSLARSELEEALVVTVVHEVVDVIDPVRRLVSNPLS